MTSDSELIARTLRSDDRSAFGELVVRHQSAVRQFLRQLTRGNVALSDDLAQETFLRAFQALPRFHGTSSFSTWLLGIAHNQWRNARRKQRDNAEFQDIPAGEAGAGEAQASDLRQDLASALSTLSTDEQLAIHLAYRQGRSHTEISRIAAWPVGTVKTHLARAKDKLRLQLASWNPLT